MKLLIPVALGLFLMLITADPGLAQSTPPLPAMPQAPAAAPIDGGLGLLAAAGAGYALRKLRKKA